MRIPSASSSVSSSMIFSSSGGFLGKQQQRVLFLRHGEAMHNPRAEAAKKAGCSFPQFLQLMKEDDVFDAPLTELGKKQAQSIVARNEIFQKISTVDVVIASPLSRAIHTADLVLSGNPTKRRISMEHFREINGWLLNAKRLPKKDLCDKYGDRWDFSLLEDDLDESWTPNSLEEPMSCAERGYQGLLWIGSQLLPSTLVVTHGGLLSHILSEKHPNIQLKDGRPPEQRDQRTLSARFANTEIREYELQFSFHDDSARPNITLIEVTDFF